MDGTARFRINNPSIVNEIIDGEVVMINLDSGSYYSADKVGAAIWELLSGGATLRELVDVVLQRYEGDVDKIEASVRTFLLRLKDECLIVPAENDKVSAKRAISNTAAKLPFQEPKLERYDDMQDLLLADPIHDVGDKSWPPKLSPSDKPN